MTKRGRPASKIHLTTGADPSLWRYDSLGHALKANVDLLAALIHGSTLAGFPEDELSVADRKPREYPVQQVAEP
jgi:hypothetical protein